MKISTKFNAALFSFYIYCNALQYFFTADNEIKTPWDRFDALYPNMSIALVVIFIITIIISAVAILKYFWNIFLADVFKLRQIDFQESLAIVQLIFITTCVYKN